MLDPQRSDLVAGVVGAGTMGRGIAQVLAQCGARTQLYDAQPRAAQKAKDAIAQSLGRLVEKGRLGAAEVQATLGRIEIVASFQALKSGTRGAEPIAEDPGAKHQLIA